MRTTLINALTLLPAASSTVFAQEVGSKLDIFFKNKPDVLNASRS